jgi:hypothetical protein
MHACTCMLACTCIVIRCIVFSKYMVILLWKRTVPLNRSFSVCLSTVSAFLFHIADASAVNFGNNLVRFDDILPPSQFFTSRYLLPQSETFLFVYVVCGSFNDNLSDSDSEGWMIGWCFVLKWKDVEGSGHDLT